jgi:hypothetical protein
MEESDFDETSGDEIEARAVEDILSELDNNQL